MPPDETLAAAPAGAHRSCSLATGTGERSRKSVLGMVGGEVLDAAKQRHRGVGFLPFAVEPAHEKPALHGHDADGPLLVLDDAFLAAVKAGIVKQREMMIYQHELCSSSVRPRKQAQAICAPRGSRPRREGTSKCRPGSLPG